MAERKVANKGLIKHSHLLEVTGRGHAIFKSMAISLVLPVG